MSTKISNWMSWEAGVDLVACTAEGLEMPNVIVHVARQVHTPVGSAPSGIVFLQPDPNAAPLAMGFVSTNPEVAAYFGPNIFAGTPFESAPVLEASIEIQTSGDEASSRIQIGDLVLETALSQLGASELVSRDPSPMSPFFQQGVERVAGAASLKVNGEALSLILPEVGITGGAPAVCAPCGSYAR